MRRYLTGVLTLALSILPAAPALAEYRGTDLWGNLVPSTGSGKFSDLHPLSYYALDYHVDVGITSPDGIPPMIAQWTSAQLFSFGIFCMRMVIGIFDWAFNLDILNGPKGTLSPVGHATQHMYVSTFVPLVSTAALLLGGWFTAKVVERKFGEAVSGGVRAICMTAAAMVIVFNSGATIGRATALVNDFSSAIISGHVNGDGGAKASDRLFDAFIYKPWVVLEFGGMQVCTGAKTDSDGFPVSVRPETPSKTCHSTTERGVDGHGGYAPLFLRYAEHSDERDGLYESIKNGTNTAVPQIPGWKVDKTDAPAVDVMQAGGAVQRLTATCLLLVGMLGAIIMLGLLCCAALFAQLGLLVMIGLAPAMVIVGIFPAVHGIFMTWLRWTGKFLIAKVVYSLLLSATINVSVALGAAAGTMGFLFAFGLQTIFFWGLFIGRKQLASIFAGRREYNRAENSTKAFAVGASTAAVCAVAAPVSTVARTSVVRSLDRRQQHAQDPATDRKSTENAPTTSTPDSSSPPASAGRDYSSGNVPSTTVATMQARKTPNDDPKERDMPTRSFRDDLEGERTAREQGETKRKPIAPPTPVLTPRLAPAGAFSSDLERARSQQQAKPPDA